jgi:biopolymer transport protein TolR
VERRKSTRLMADINVTPFVDVMLVLLVIFMITTPLMQHGMDLELPQESTETVEIKDIPTVSVRSNKTIYWNKEKMATLMTLTEKLTGYLKKRKDGAVYFRADRSLDYGFVIKVMTTLRRAGVRNIGMMTEPGQ